MRTIEIKIVGSIGDQDDVTTIKRITEVFLIETRIRGILEKKTQEKKRSEVLPLEISSPPPLQK